MRILKPQYCDKCGAMCAPYDGHCCNDNRDDAPYMRMPGEFIDVSIPDASKEPFTVERLENFFKTQRNEPA